MFLSKQYVLSSELVDFLGINISNISMIRGKLEEMDDCSTIVKRSNCTFIKDSERLPKYIRSGLANALGQGKLTSMHNKLPVRHISAEYELSEEEWYDSGALKGRVNVAGKELYEFNEDFVKKVKGKIVYILNTKEADECLAKKQIEGRLRASFDKWITWY